MLAVLTTAGVVIVANVAGGVSDDVIRRPRRVRRLALPTRCSLWIPRRCRDGYYLRGHERRRAAARRAQGLTVEARAAGYTDSKIVRHPGTVSKCTEDSFFDRVPAVGYIVVLKGPIPLPPDVTDEY